MIPYIGVVVLDIGIHQFEQTFLKISDGIRVYGVGKHNHPGHRSDVYDDNRHCDDDVDDDLLGSCSDTYI